MRLPTVRVALGLVSLAAIGGWALAGSGCGAASPFATTAFFQTSVNAFPNQTFPRGGIGTGPGGVTPPTTQPTSTVNSTCDLTLARKTMTMILRNESTQNVRYNLTFLVSAGSGGFVCDADRASYLAAGYTSLGGSVTLGCVTITPSVVNGFRGGNELLGRSFGRDSFNNPILLPPNVSGTTSGAPVAPAPLNGVTPIPTPEVIVLGNSESIFTCQANDPCTQGGFVYVTAQGVQIDDIFARRTQGTLCNTNAGSRAEWRLLNPSNADSTAQAFQFVAGASISVTVLDRVFNNVATQNKVVWQVIGPVPGLVQVHSEAR